jgi:hypothetical protein
MLRSEVHRVEVLLMRIIGVLLVLLGLALFASPYIPYTTREQIGNTDLSVKRKKTIVVPRPVSAIIVAGGRKAISRLFFTRPFPFSFSASARQSRRKCRIPYHRSPFGDSPSF